MRDRLGRARNLFAGYLTSVRSRDRIDEATWEELEEGLILADVGAELSARILDDLRSRVKSEGISSPEDLVGALKAELVAALDGDGELHLVPDVTNVWLFVGVNGVGKTTTIGKLGMRQVRNGHRVVMAAGDTFRAAAADQLELWATRSAHRSSGATREAIRARLSSTRCSTPPPETPIWSSPIPPVVCTPRRTSWKS